MLETGCSALHTSESDKLSCFFILMNRYAEFHIERDWNVWVLMLTLSLSAWRASLSLHQHPEYIASLATNIM